MTVIGMNRGGFQHLPAFKETPVCKSTTVEPLLRDHPFWKGHLTM